MGERLELKHKENTTILGSPLSYLALGTMERIGNAKAGRSRCFVDISSSVSEAIESDEINKLRYLFHAGTFHYSCGDFADCAADKDVGGYKGSIFLGYVISSP